jgi:putative transcriptional regulator
MIVYTIDILDALKKRGYNTNRIRLENILSQSTLQKIRTGKYISIESLDTLCSLLNCQPGDIIAYIPDDQQQDAKQ